MHLSELYKNGKFIITCELDPPKGVNIEEFLNNVDLVKGYVDAINIGDNQRAVMRASSLAICRLLKERGIETIMETSARDRNRIALQSDLLGAAILGIENILIIDGDLLEVGDHTEAKPVYDLDKTALLNAAVTLTKGTDMTGHALDEAPSLCCGVMAVPELVTDSKQLEQLKKEIDNGARFIQTQTVYKPEVLERFMESVSAFNVPVIVGHMMLKSASMASFMNSNFTGVNVPQSMIDELVGLPRPQLIEKSLQISIELLKKMKPVCNGFHFMPAGWERYVPRIVEQVR